MKGIIYATARLIEAAKRAYARKWTFLVLFLIAFSGSVFALGTLDLLPDAPPAPAAAVAAADGPARAQVPTVAETPVKIEIQKLNRTADVVNPATTDIAVLDEALLAGAVHYSTSAALGEEGNVVLFGHSSYLPIVGNRAYKTFNDIQKLSAGDVVTVSSSRTAYTYKVRTVMKESVADNKPIPLSVSGRELTLVTCNSFATKSDRFIVVADFVESRALLSR